MNSGKLSLEGNRILLRQGLALLDRLSDELYAERRGSWAPIGAQYRHILDHYGAFFRGLAPGRVDYDARTRDETLETGRDNAHLATISYLEALDALEGGADQPLMVQMDSGAGPDAPDWRPSSAGRELQFLCSHTVHHFAQIQFLLAGTGVVLDPECGTAPSTLAYQRIAAQ